jgi:hypothetical protein
MHDQNAAADLFQSGDNLSLIAVFALGVLRRASGHDVLRQKAHTVRPWRVTNSREPQDAHFPKFIGLTAVIADLFCCAICCNWN